MPGSWVTVPGFKHKVTARFAKQIEQDFMRQGFQCSASGLTATIARMFCEKNRISYTMVYGEHGGITIAEYKRD